MDKPSIEETLDEARFELELPVRLAPETPKAPEPATESDELAW